MKKLKYVTVLLATLVAGIVLFSNQSASASSYWASKHWVTLKKNVTVKKVKNVYPLYKSHVVKSYTAKKGSHYKMGHYGANYSWVLYSGKFKSNSKYTYAVSAPAGSWYRKGIHKLKVKTYKSKYKVAKYSEFSSSEFRTGYVDVNSTPYEFDDSDLNKVFTIKSNLTKLSVKKDGKDDTGTPIIAVNYNGMHVHDWYKSGSKYVHPYNSEKLDKNTINSQTTPYSGKAVIKRGINMKKIKEWYYSYSNGNKSIIYKHVKSGWQAE